jgi:hypothetical protein
LVAVLLCNAKDMTRVAAIRPTGFWGLWCRLAVGVVVDGGFGYVVEMVVVGFSYVVELRTLVLANGEY